MIDNIDLSKIQDENARELIKRLLNLIEKLSADLRDAQNEIQRMRDEVNRLKGEQGKPKIKGNTPKLVPTNHSSEKERSKPHERRRRSKKAEIHINEEKVVTVDPAIMPEDAKFKGYEDVVVQDILCLPITHRKKNGANRTNGGEGARKPKSRSMRKK